MTPKLVIFDCDGVLVDSEPATDQVLARNLNSYGLEIAPHEIHSLFAGGTMEAVGDTARARGAALPADWLDQIYSEVFDELRKGVPVIEGVLDLIRALDDAGIKRAIASNGPIPKMEISLTPSGLWDMFQGQIYSGHIHRPKPNPDMLLKIAADAGIDPTDAVMIDDMPAGFLAAKAGRMRCFGYVADGDPLRIGDTGAIPVTSMQQITQALGL